MRCRAAADSEAAGIIGTENPNKDPRRKIREKILASNRKQKPGTGNQENQEQADRKRISVNR
jgi:hypothetical protein